MNKKGFTLVELLAVVVILTILYLMGNVLYTNISHASKESDYEYIISLIKNAANDYFNNNDDITYIFVDNLINENYLIPSDGKTLTDPRDDKNLNCLLITKNNDDVIISDDVYKLSNDTCAYIDIRLNNDLDNEINSNILIDITKSNYLVLYDVINNQIYNGSYKWYINNNLIYTGSKLPLSYLENNYNGIIKVDFDYEISKNIQLSN